MVHSARFLSRLVKVITFQVLTEKFSSSGEFTYLENVIFHKLRLFVCEEEVSLGGSILPSATANLNFRVTFGKVVYHISGDRCLRCNLGLPRLSVGTQPIRRCGWDRRAQRPRPGRSHLPTGWRPHRGLVADAALLIFGDHLVLATDPVVSNGK